MPGKEKKNAGVWQPVPPSPDPPAATNKRMAMGAVLPTLGRTFRPDHWENIAAEEKSGLFLILTFFNAYGVKKKIHLCLYSRGGKSIIFLVFT
jgi:hypothetical protein